VRLSYGNKGFTYLLTYFSRLIIFNFTYQYIAMCRRVLQRWIQLDRYRQSYLECYDRWQEDYNLRCSLHTRYCLHHNNKPTDWV